MSPLPDPEPQASDYFSRIKRAKLWKQLDLLHLTICILIVGLAIVGLASGRFMRVENIFLDYLLRQRPSLSVHPDIALIEIDQESVQAIGPWPWPWRYHAQMIELLKEWKARAAVFTFSFKDPSGEEEAAQLEEALKANPTVYLPVILESKTEKRIWIHSRPISLEPEGEKKIWGHSLPALERHAKGLGHAYVETDPDGVVRRIKPYLANGNEMYPYLALRAAYDDQGKALPAPSGLRLPHDAQGELLINWSGKWHEGFQNYSYADLIRSAQAISQGQDPVVDLKKLKDKICLIGVSAPGAADFKATPLESTYPTWQIQAQVMNNILTHQFLSPVSFEINSFCLGMMGFIASLLFAFFRNVRSFVAGLALGGLWLVVSCIVFREKGIWLYAAQPLLLILCLFIFSAIYMQITSGRERAKLFDLATRDGLTGLYVIRHFREILNRVVEEAKIQKEPLALILIDIDNFKPINDTYGHQAGDMVLKKIAQIIATCFRSKRSWELVDFIARYGGEEFIVLVRKASLKDAAFKAAERIRAAVEKAVFDWEGKRIAVTISLGVASLHPGENVPDIMVRRADEALYRAKKNGKNQVCIETVFDPGAGRKD